MNRGKGSSLEHKMLLLTEWHIPNLVGFLSEPTIR